MRYISDIFRLMRPKSWIKNGLVFLPAFFSGQAMASPCAVGAISAAAGFCLLSSCVYAANDVHDAAYDRSRADRRGRPVASGRVGAPAAIAVSGLCGLVGLACLALFTTAGAAWLGAAYLAVNAAYTVRLKREPVVDVACIAAGFVLRVYAGAAACGVPVSGWLFLTVVSAAMFMGFGKRYGEMVFSGEDEWRHVVGRYDAVFLRGAVFLSAGLALCFYSLWAMQSYGGRPLYSVPVLLFLLLRYLLDVFRDVGGGDPVSIFYGDLPLSAGVVAYGVLMAALLYA